MEDEIIQSGDRWLVRDGKTGAFVGEYRTRWEAEAIKKAYGKAGDATRRSFAIHWRDEHGGVQGIDVPAGYLSRECGRIVDQVIAGNTSIDAAGDEIDFGAGQSNGPESGVDLRDV